MNKPRSVIGALAALFIALFKPTPVSAQDNTFTLFGVSLPVELVLIAIVGALLVIGLVAAFLFEHHDQKIRTNPTK
jgi:hypothetical protein